MSNQKTGKQKMTAKEITMAGALGAVIIVIRFVFVALGAVSPYVWLFVTHPAMTILIAPVFMLLVAKSEKNGAFFIIDLIFGVIMAGGTWMVTVAMIIGGFLCELCLKKGRFGKGFWTFLGFLCFQAGMIAEFFPLWLTKDTYLSYVRKTMSGEYADVLEGTITAPVLTAIIGIEIISALIGYFFGKAVMGKHFRRADLAQTGKGRE